METRYALSMKPTAKRDAVVVGDRYRFTILTDSLIRLEYQEEGRFVDEATQTVICRDFPEVEYRVIDKDNSLEIVTDKLHLYYDKKPFSREGLTIELKGGFHVYGSAWRYGEPIEDLGGTARTLDGIDGAVALEHGLLSRGGFTVLDDSASALIGADQWPAAKDRQSMSIDLYFFGYGHDYLRCLRDFYHLSGATPLLPRFTLGNWWSRFYRYSEESYLALMETFQERDIPLSTAVIDMDWHLTDIPKKYGSGWTGYTWNPELFPDPKRFMDRLHEMGLHITLNVHPADGVRGHEKNYLPMAKELGIDYENEDKIPFDAANRRFLEAYFKYLHHPNEEDGVDFWWVDWQQGNRGGAAGIDTLWLLNHLHFLDSGRNGKQPLTFSRYAGLGSHRYPIGFSGDSFSTWDSLDFQPYFTANASNAGYSWWSHDIGGHQGGRRDDELVVRWLQFGVFSPIMRLHSTSNPFYGKEPWNYNPAAETTMTQFLRLRHRLIPYLYTMNYLTAEEGIPLMRPMYYHHDVPEAYTVPNEYWFGTEMIVCPITSPADARSKLAQFHAWLPEGTYYDFFSKCVYRGGKRITLCRPLDQIPVLVPAGSIIPLAGDYKTSHISNPKELEVQVYHGSDGAFTLVEDDCSECQSAAAQRTQFTYELAGDKGAVLRMEQVGENTGLIPAERTYQITIFGISEPESIDVRGGAEANWAYKSQEAALHIEISGQAICWFEVRIGLADQKIVGQDKLPQVFAILQYAQIEYELKDKIFDTVANGRNTAGILAALVEMQVEQALYEAIAEILTMDL